MEESVVSAITRCRSVRRMLDSIPRELWYMFVPGSVEEMVALDAGIRAFERREKSRQKVISMQRRHGRPLRPNEPLHEAAAKIRISALKKKMEPEGFADGGRDW
jgi:hypothetical protein